MSMMKKFTYLLSFLICLTFAKVNAQDIHFSQYYASPLTLNPALTGLINGDFRIAANYRGQWFTIPTMSSNAPYNTYQASFDASLFRKKLGNSGLGVGAMFYADEAGNGSLTSFAAMGNIAYHQSIDRFGRSRLSLGFQAGMIQKRIFQYDLLFERQFDPGLNSFNPFINNGEADFNDGGFTYFDMNVGALFSSRATDKFSYYLGFAANHVTRPAESFLGNAGNSIDIRYIAHAGMEIKTSRYFKLLPTIFYTMQTNAQQFNVGSGFEYAFSDNFSGFAGAFTRVVGGIDQFRNDAFIVTAGVQTNGLRIGASYDFTTSPLRGATNSVGAFEVSLIYIHGQEDGKISYERFCPSF